MKLVTNNNNNKKIEDAYSAYAEGMLAYALHRNCPDHEDVVHDTFLEVMAMPNVPDGDIEGLLIQRLKWRISDAMRASREVLESDLGTVDDDGQERPMDLGDLEDIQSEHGRTPPWPTAVNFDTPEDIVTASQMRDRIRTHATRLCGERDYAVFCAVVIDDVPQSRVAKEFRMDQATVSRIVQNVRDTVGTQLRAEGYAV